MRILHQWFSWNYSACRLPQDELRALIQELQQAVGSQGQIIVTLQQTVGSQGQIIVTLQQTVGSQNESIATLQATVDDKCETIEQLQMNLQQLNNTLQMFIDDQGMSDSQRKRFKMLHVCQNASALCSPAFDLLQIYAQFVISKGEGGIKCIK